MRRATGLEQPHTTMPSTSRLYRVTDDPIIVGALVKTNAFRKAI